MSISVGSAFPQVSLKAVINGEVQQLDTKEFFHDKKVVLFSVPGAFTPTCSNTHLPGYVEQARAFFHKGIDAIVCLSVNDAFVMKAWAEAHGAEEEIIMFADGNAELTEALDLVLDGTAFGMGKRSTRAFMIVDDGAIEEVTVESNPGVVATSGASSCFAKV